MILNLIDKNKCNVVSMEFLQSCHLFSKGGKIYWFRKLFHFFKCKSFCKVSDMFYCRELSSSLSPCHGMCQPL